MPLLVLPPRANCNIGTLIDNINFFEGKCEHTETIRCGNILTDVLEYLPNYFLLMQEQTKYKMARPIVRLLLKKKRIS
jgi:hypothetical protein